MGTIVRVADSIFLLVGALLKLAAAVILPYLVWKIYLARHRRQLVVGNFVNGSGIGDVDAALAGLSVMARHRLVAQMDLVRSRVQGKSKAVGFHLQDKAPLPRGTPDQSLDALVSSLKAAIPKEAAPALNIVRELVLRPSGDQITTTLVALDGNGHRVGIIFEVTSLSGDEGPQPITLSEPLPPDDEAHPASALERYIKLLDPAARLLALELSRREILIAGERTPRVDRIRVRGDQRKARRRKFEAAIHNFFGTLYQASAPTFAAHGDFFYDLAAQEFAAASSLVPEMYQARENLADTYSLRARSLPEQAADALHQRALVEYQEAYVRTARVPDAGERDTAKRRIAIGQATSKLLSSGQSQWEEASKEIEVLEERWRPAAEKNGRILYNLASWYGIALGRNMYPDLPTKRAKARALLAYGLARDSRLVSWATKDPDLQPLRDGLERLHIELAKKKVEVPELGELPDQDFKKAMQDVLERAGWDDGGSGGP